MDKTKNILLIILTVLFFYSCSTSPYDVSKDDTQVALNTDVGEIIDVVPVKIKGKPSEIGATVGGMIGSIVGSDVGSGKGQEIAIIVGATLGGVAGYYSTVRLGEHNGYQYTISIDGENKPIGLVQGIDKEKNALFKVGDRVSIVYGEQVRVLPLKN